MKLFIKLLLLLVLSGIAFVHFFLPAQVERGMNVTEGNSSYAIRPDAQQLHDSLFIVDLHADSLLWKRNLLKRSSIGHLDLPRMQEGNVALQVFSATTKSPPGLNYASNTATGDDITKLAVLSFWPPRTWNSLFERASYQLSKLEKFAAKSNGQLTVIRTRQDFKSLIEERAAGNNVIGGLFLIEGAHPLEGDVENLDRLFQQGLRIAGLTHFFDNELGGSLHGISGDGLTDFGIQVIQRADQLGIIIDVAHSSAAMVRDVLALTSRPLILSHGGMAGACDTDRNLDDELMNEIAATGGIVGIGYWQGAICDISPQGIVKSIRYAIDTMGIDHVALGSDYDGTVTTEFDTSGLAILTQTMLDQGFTESEIRAVMGENVKRLFLQQLPDQQ